MSTLKSYGISIVHGVRDPLPLAFFPAGKWRLKMRSNGPAKLFVKTATGIESYFIKEFEGKWIPAFRDGVNVHAP